MFFYHAIMPSATAVCVGSITNVDGKDARTIELVGSWRDHPQARIGAGARTKAAPRNTLSIRAQHFLVGGHLRPHAVGLADFRTAQPRTGQKLRDTAGHLVGIA